MTDAAVAVGICGPVLAGGIVLLAAFLCLVIHEQR